MVTIFANKPMSPEQFKEFKETEAKLSAHYLYWIAFRPDRFITENPDGTVKIDIDFSSSAHFPEIPPTWKETFLCYSTQIFVAITIKNLIIENFKKLFPNTKSKGPLLKVEEDTAMTIMLSDEKRIQACKAAFNDILTNKPISYKNEYQINDFYPKRDASELADKEHKLAAESRLRVFR